MEIKIISNSDAFPASRASFTPAAAASYRVIVNGALTAEIVKIPMKLSQINPDWTGTDECWACYSDGSLIAADQRLGPVRAAVRAHFS